jgi:hypothetical protein
MVSTSSSLITLLDHGLEGGDLLLEGILADSKTQDVRHKQHPHYAIGYEDAEQVLHGPSFHLIAV